MMLLEKEESWQIFLNFFLSRMTSDDNYNAPRVLFFFLLFFPNKINAKIGA